LAELLSAHETEEGYSGAWLGARSVIGEERFDPNVMVHMPEGWSSFADLPNRKVTMDCLYHHPDDFSAFTVFSKDGKAKGTHCSRCNRTWWPREALIPVYDFTAFNKSLKDKLKTTARYFRKPTIRWGLNLNISPVGTGKTKALEDVLAAYPTVLVISHRRLLCNELSRRLNVVDYQDHPNSRALEFPRLVVCLDSLRKVAFDKITYKVVVLDESEQILKDFLGGTMEGRDPYDMFLLFQEVIRIADIVIAQDADLGWITYNTLGKLKVIAQARSPSRIKLGGGLGGLRG
jgi:Origin of replication binding protein